MAKMPVWFKNSDKYLVTHKPRSKDIKHFLAPYNLHDHLNPICPEVTTALLFGSFPFLSSITTAVCIQLNNEVFNFLKLNSKCTQVCKKKKAK